ncbi:unnamed protein product [Urochloa humidicola]
MWDGEKQRLTAMHWLVAYGLGKKSRAVAAGKAGNDVMWSMSSRVMADMWFKPLRNPDSFLNAPVKHHLTTMLYPEGC